MTALVAAIWGFLPCHATAASQSVLYPNELGCADFGSAIAISGDTAVIGAPTSQSGSGAAYVFLRSGEDWVLQTKLTAGDGAVGNFGNSVAISGDTVVIGAQSASAAYVFVRSGDVWTQQAKLTEPAGAAEGVFGSSVAVSADTALIGAPGQYGGSAYVFTRSDTTWFLQEELSTSDSPMLYFGNSVAVSGDTAVVAGVLATPSPARAWNVAYVFALSEGTWTQRARLSASYGCDIGLEAASVAISGDTVVVGAPYDDDGGGEYGSAYVFARSGDGWTQQARLTATDGRTLFDGFGRRATIDGANILVFGDRTNGGAVYAFTRSGDTWTESAKLTKSDRAPGDSFGARSVAVLGNTAMVGCPGDCCGGGLGSGAVYVFDVAEEKDPSTVGVVFINGLRSDNAQYLDDDSLPESDDNQLSHYFNMAQDEGFRPFMIASRAHGARQSRRRGIPCINSDSPDLADNGEQVSLFLKSLKAAGVDRVVIVAHSYGGLVARQFIEGYYSSESEEYPQVCGLVTLGTPHAGFHPGGETALRWLRQIYALTKIEFLNPTAAGRVLVPDEMRKFNAVWAHRSPEVPYTLIAGQLGRPPMGSADWFARLRLLYGSLWGLEGESAIPTDFFVHTESAAGRYSDGEEVFSDDRDVTRVYLADHYHGLFPPEAADYALFTPMDLTLTFDDDVYGQYISPLVWDAALPTTEPTKP